MGFTQLTTEEKCTSEVGACPPVGRRMSRPLDTESRLPTYLLVTAYQPLLAASTLRGLAALRLRSTVWRFPSPLAA